MRRDQWLRLWVWVAVVVGMALLLGSFWGFILVWLFNNGCT